MPWVLLRRFHDVQHPPAHLELLCGEIQQLQKFIDVPDMGVYGPAAVKCNVLHREIVDR